MRYMLITDDAGKLVGAVKGDTLSQKSGDVEVTLVAGPGQRMHHIDLDTETAEIEDADELHAKLAEHLATLPKQ